MSFAQGELIGLAVEVEGKGKKGRVVDETRNLLVIEDDGKETRWVKKDHTFRFPEKNTAVEGRLLVGKPEERIKKSVKQ
ncbi:MAG: ribonuclease P protein subunit [Nanoarchaeota archaeon]|nr:ribonuclease P protein subunit [Nanoarchaeota archaeon]